jgi:hypothetical protein
MAKKETPEDIFASRSAIIDAWQRLDIPVQSDIAVQN